MQAVYTRSLPHQLHSRRLSPPSCLKSHLIGLVWSHASISIHLLWPWLNLIGVKEVFTLAACTLIVCLADLVNWKRRKWSQSVRLIGSTTPHHPLHCLHNPAPILCILSRFTLGFSVTFCLGQDFSVYRCVCVWACMHVCMCMCVLYVYICVGKICIDWGGNKAWSRRWTRGEWTLVEWGGVKKVWSN